jgi:hypothetical protein
MGRQAEVVSGLNSSDSRSAFCNCRSRKSSNRHGVLFRGHLKGITCCSLAGIVLCEQQDADPSSLSLSQSYADVPVTDDGVDTLSFLLASEGLVKLFGACPPHYFYSATQRRKKKLSHVTIQNVPLARGHWRVRLCVSRSVRLSGFWRRPKGPYGQHRGETFLSPFLSCCVVPLALVFSLPHLFYFSRSDSTRLSISSVPHSPSPLWLRCRAVFLGPRCSAPSVHLSPRWRACS